MSLLSSESGVLWGARYIPGVLFTGYQIANEINKRKLASQYLKEAYCMYLTLEGPSSPATVRAHELLDAATAVAGASSSYHSQR